MSSDSRIYGMFCQIRKAILQLLEWNEEVHSPEDYYSSAEGMKNLAASCMLIEAIGEGIKRIDDITRSKLLVERPEIPCPEIPWIDVIGIRNHIAHGYFDIDGDIVYDVVKNNLQDLLLAVDYFLEKMKPSLNRTEG